MAIILNADTQRLIEERMKDAGFSTPDDLVRVALQALDRAQGEDFSQLDPETQADLEEGLAQADRGEGRPWHEVRKELRQRFTGQ